jgi:endonuclease/exonuclease/phosphatase family metal-dependent hydrolase
MARFVRTLARRILIALNIVVVVLFLLACSNAWLHPAEWWYISLLGLGFPFILILVIVFLAIWISVRSRWALLSLVALLLGFTNIRAFFGFHFNDRFRAEKEKDAIRILTWNIEWFGEHQKTKYGKDNRKKMLEFIQQQNADILCFQEFLEPGKTVARSNEEAIRKLHYPYHYRVIDYGRKNGPYEVGVAIFSRYPIVDTMHIRYPGPETMRAAESLIAADVAIAGKTFRFFTTHLQSVLFGSTDYRNLEIIKNADDSLITASKSIIRKLRQGYALRGYQADLVRQHLDASPYPAIICGDFNDVPNSYTYFRIRGNRQDAFISSNSGVGRTYAHLSPTLRIDYILADPAFEVLQCRRFQLPYSDHYPVVADVRLADSGK